MVTLDARLAAAAELVPHNSTLLDIGSDHALLPIYLLQSGKIKRAAASDINAAPLQRGRKNAEKYGVLEQMGFYLSDGLRQIPQSYDTVAICGMGGMLIRDIIKSGGCPRRTTFVLQPMTAAEVLREFLWQSGFVIQDEAYAIAANKPYAVMRVVAGDAPIEYDYTDTYLGKIRPKTAEFARYAHKVKLSAQKRLTGAVCRGEPTDELEELIRNAQCATRN